MLFNLADLSTKKAETKTTDITPILSKAEIVLQETFPHIQKNTDYPYCSGGDWSTHDMIFHIIKHIGPAHLTACTWSVGEHVTHRLIDAMSKGEILTVNFLVDWRVSVRTPSFMAVAKQNFAKIRVSSCHAKAFVLQNEKWTVSCVGSANFTNNPRIEAGHISTNPVVGEFHKKWIQQEIDNAKPFGIDMRSKGKKDGRK